MSKVKIYDLAKELNLDNKQIIEEIRRLGYKVNLPTNSIPLDIAEKVKRKYLHSPPKGAKVIQSRKEIENAQIIRNTDNIELPSVSTTERYSMKNYSPVEKPEEKNLSLFAPANCIVVISALSEELTYLHEEDFNWSDIRRSRKGISYREGYFKNFNIITCAVGKMGLTDTAILTTKVLEEWNPTITAMIGICGGRKEEGVNIGDIVFPDKCFHYQFGAFQDGEIKREICDEKVDQYLLEIAKSLTKPKSSVLSNIKDSLQEGFKKPVFSLKCHFYPMASADLVVKDTGKLNDAVVSDRKTVAIDMESYAFMRAANVAKTKWHFVVKSVTDFADAKKDDEYREYAKYTSAKFFVYFIEKLLQDE